MATQFDDFLPSIMPMVPGCPVGVALNAVRQSCIDFCVVSRYWQEDLPAIDAVANQQTYPLVAPSGAKVAAVTKVVFNGRDIDEAGISASAVQKAATGSDAVTYFIEADSANYLLRPYPVVDRNLAGAFVVTAVLKPDVDATSVGDLVYLDHQETIVAGALERLLRMRGKAWFNSVLAADMGVDFRRGRGAARVHVSKGCSNQSLRVKPRPFA